MNVTVPEQIRIICARKGMTLSDLAQRLNMSTQGLSQTLRRGNMTLSTVGRIADALGCELVVELKEAEV